MKIYRSIEGKVTALATKTQLSTLGSSGTILPLLVPAGVSKISALIIAAIPDFSAAADGATIVRLEGPALPDGPEVVVAGATGVQVATGGCAAIKAARIPIEIPVTVANELLVFAEITGEDTGLVVVGVTVEFSS